MESLHAIIRGIYDTFFILFKYVVCMYVFLTSTALQRLYFKVPNPKLSSILNNPLYETLTLFMNFL